MRIPIKNLLTITLACNKFDYNDIVELYERGNLNKEDWGYGYWQNFISILPNIAKTKEIMCGINPIAQGKFWLIYDMQDIENSNELCDELDKEDLWLIDYITKDDFAKEGIVE